MLTRIREWIARLEANPKAAPYMQFIKFGIVGVSNTLISLGTYWLCFYGFGWYYQISNIISFLVSVTNAYYWNSRYVFQNGRDYRIGEHIRAYFKAMISYGSTFLLSTALLTLWVEVCGINAGIAPLINLLITIPLNFFLNKHWAFRNKNQKTPEERKEK